MRIRIGTRGSQLAKWQANWVAERLAEQGIDTEIILLKTLGDVRSQPIETLDGDGVFTREIQRALLEDQVDLAVHSLKDLPTEQVAGLRLAVVPERESCGDALIARNANSLDELESKARVGTGSARRRAQLLVARPDLSVQPIRGNVDTRIKKLQQGEFDAIILAEAGLRRLGFSDLISQVIPTSTMLPAVGQGALGLEIRDTDSVTAQRLQFLNHEDSFYSVCCERAFLRNIQGGCLAPVGAWARIQENMLRLDAVVLDHDGKRRVAASGTAPKLDYEQLGESIAGDLISQGADQMLARH